MPKSPIALAIVFAITSLVVVSYTIAGSRRIYAPNAASGTLHFRPQCEPEAKQLLKIHNDTTGITFEQYRRAKIWLDMCSACVDDRGPQCWTLFERLHPEAVRN